MWLSPLIILVLAIAPATTNPIFPLRQPPGTPTSPRALLGDAADRVLQNPAIVAITRVGGDGTDFDKPNVEGFEAKGGKLVREPPQIVELRNALLDPANYDFSKWGENKWCGTFDPAFAITFTRDQATVVALFCFKCDDVVLVVRDARLELQFATWADVKPGRAKFLAIAKAAFPDDEVIRGLEP